MAYQHFYSRVPSRVSMFNRADSFDTFAHSPELERAFIERDLAVMYDNKLSKNDMTMVRKGELPPVYSQCCLRTGDLVQSCVSYLPKDYTGERSAYLVHSLVLTEEERRMLLCDRDNAVLNPEMFLTDISAFDLTSLRSRPDNMYPALEYVPRLTGDTKRIVEKYSPETLKSFLYAVLLSLCGKGKNVCFKLPYANDVLSAQALEFINGVMSIIPYHMRPALSFVTYLNDYTQYTSFKLKCIAGDCADTLPAKAVFFDFKTDLIVGLSHDEVVSNKTLINFFYSLLENSEIRAEFLRYIDQAVNTLPKLQNMNFKTLNDLVFLFGQCGGLFSEFALPNDAKVYEFMCIYEKYRPALKDEYRISAYKCLGRYPKRHEAIPKNIFSKVSRLYPNELRPAKRVVMNVMLELIHTDIMREKLFVFIRNNYENEDADIKAAINEDLCRVFYGGFLQQNLLDFFTRNFAGEPIETQNIVVEKILLAIRTAAIRTKIIQFFDLHYDILSELHKENLYYTFFEMLPECDELALALVELVNTHIGKETDEFAADVARKLAVLLEADCRRKEHRMLSVLIAKKGFCDDVVTRLVFGDWNSRKIYTEYIELLQSKTVLEKTEKIIHICSFIPENLSDRLMQSMEEMFRKDIGRTDLYSWLEMADMLEGTDWGRHPTFKQRLQEGVLYRGIEASLHDVFKIRYRKDGMELLRKYMEENPYIRSCQQYGLIDAYESLLQAVRIKDIKEAFRILGTLPDNKRLRTDMAGHIYTCVYDVNKQSEEELLIMDFVMEYMKKERFDIKRIYVQHQERIRQQQFIQYGSKANVEKVQQDAIVKSMERIISCCGCICSVSKAMCGTICCEESGLESCVRDFMKSYSKGADKWLYAQLNESRGECEEFAKFFRELIELCKPQKTTFWTKMFGKP